MRLIGTIGIIGLLACEDETPGVKNVAPEITTISVTPDSGITTSTLLECLATAEDENDDAIIISYVWTDSQGIELGSDGECN